ncbi:spherulation-specific family 4 protein [Streptomyces sichuanensis]|uniref:spherulation-specific family 4 protein n=1 Tax=Streptomyces sichuanensis TaxID=2871810 RepID=UPI0035571FDB
MSYLISPGHRRAPAARKAPLRIAVPGFAHPLVAPAEWGGLQRTGLPLDWVVLGAGTLRGTGGPGGGPDGSVGGPGFRQDPYCLSAVVPLRTSGVRVLGHLDTGHGTRPFGELLSDAQRYLNWYRVDGFALGRCPTDAAGLPGIRRVAGALRTLLDAAHVVLVQGGPACSGYAAVADQLVTFAGPWSRYRWSQAPEWTAEHPPERFCHLVHGVPRHHLDEALRIARWQGAGTVYLTDRTDHDDVDPWESLPGYWDDIVSRIGPGVSE